MDNDILFEREKRWLLKEKYHGTKSSDYTADVERLQRGIPVDYVIGYRDFLECHIDLSHHPLIPRNETEYWTRQIIHEYNNLQHTLPKKLRVLDIFAGSGCIGIALLKHLSNCTVDFVEYNPNFVKQIQKNLNQNQINPDSYGIYQSDMFSALPNESSLFGYDLIVANPPYIAHDRINTVQNSVHDNEDPDSLYADDDGLYFIKNTIQALPQYLVSGGNCYIEYDSWQTNLIIQYIDTHHTDLTSKIILDQFGKERIIKITK